jgi:hypothetical protein
MTTRIKAFAEAQSQPLNIVVKYAYRNTSDEDLLAFLHKRPVIKPTTVVNGSVNFSVYSKSDKQVMFVNDFENNLDDESSKTKVTATIKKLRELLDTLKPENLQRQMTDAEALSDLQA